MTDQIWSWLAGGIGLIGFWLGGKKVWWCWYVNVVNQVAWAAFAIITGYYAFLVTAAVYFVVFSRNAYLWTRDHRREKERLDELIGYAKKDAEATMQLYQGEDALRFLGMQGSSVSVNPEPVEPYRYFAHILRLEDRIPICERPNDSDTFVIHEGVMKDKPPCPDCPGVIEAWVKADPFGLVRIEGKPKDEPPQGRFRKEET